MAWNTPPQIQSFWPALNIIRNVIEADCGDYWHLIVDLALPAAGSSIWLLIVPSPGEILEEFLHPGPRRHGKKGAPLLKSKWVAGALAVERKLLTPPIPDVDEMIAQRIPLRAFFEGRQAGALERWVWTGIDIVDRIGWYWLLIDATENFVYKWASGIMESRYCANAWDGLFYATANIPIFAAINIGWGAIPTLNVISNSGWQVKANGQITRSTIAQGVDGTIVSSNVFHIVLSGITKPNCTLRVKVVWNEVGVGTHTELGPTVPVKDAGTFHVDHNFDVTKGYDFTFSVICSDASFISTNLSSRESVFTCLTRKH